MTDAERIEELEREVARLNRCLEDAQKASAAYQVEREEDHEAILHLGASLEEEKARVIHPLARGVLELWDDHEDGDAAFRVWCSMGRPITTKPDCDECRKQERECSGGAIQAIVRMGHTEHCAKRQAWGDGECECVKPATPALTRESLLRLHRLLTAADALKRSLNAHDNSEAIKALEDEACRVAGVVRG